MNQETVNSRPMPAFDEEDVDRAMVPLGERGVAGAAGGAMYEAERSRAVQEIQAALVIAKRFPRDTDQAFTKIMKECRRLTLATMSVYRYPKGGQKVEGPSIRLAEVMARAYGNLDFGVKEVERRDGVSVMQSFCWDLENNVMAKKTFEVPHSYMSNKKLKKLTDPRDVYEHTANQAARRLRACILHIIPGDIVDAAVAQCRKTVAAGDGKETLEDRVRKMVLAFSDIGVSQAMLEDFMKHEAALTTAEEIVDLTSIYTAIRDKQAKRRDFFKFAEPEESGGKAAEFRESLRNNQPEGEENEDEVQETGD